MEFWREVWNGYKERIGIVLMIWLVLTVFLALIATVLGWR